MQGSNNNIAMANEGGTTGEPLAPAMGEGIFYDEEYAKTCKI